jgi:predicted AAA+ superfamily ATPase
MTDDELKELVTSLAVAQKATEVQMKATSKQIKHNDKMLTEKLDRTGITLGDIGQNQGDVAEEFFFQSLIKDNHLDSIHFDDVMKNMMKYRGQIQEEFDLFLTNGDAIAIVEVKYKAHEHDLDKLDRKMKNFKKLFPIYQAFKQYGAIAAFHINDNAKEEALRRGYFVLQRSGDLVHTESSEHLTVL